MGVSAEQVELAMEYEDQTAVWLYHADGSTSIVPDCDISQYQGRKADPKYICRIGALRGLRTLGDERAASLINMQLGVS